MKVPPVLGLIHWLIHYSLASHLMESTSTCQLSFFRLCSLRTLSGLLAGFLLVFSFSAHAQPGLVAQYAFNGTFLDQTSNGNHGVPMGNPTFTTDRAGNPNSAVSLGGCGNPQFVRVPHSSSLDINEAMTISFWAKVDLDSGMDPGTGACNVNGRQVFFAKGGDGYGGSPPGIQGLTFQQNAQQYISFESSTNSGQASVMASRSLPGDAWHYYTYVITTSELRLYVDAQLIHTRPVSLNFFEANQQDLYLGAMGPKSSPVLGITNWYPLKGAMDDVRMFNRALTQQEIITFFVSDDAGNCALTLSVLPAGNQTICEGQSITLNGVPSSDVQLQWLKNGQPIAQATLDSLVVSQAGSYRLVATRRTDTWKHDMPGFDKTLNDVQYVGTTGWIVGEYGTLLKTTNGGTSWDTIPTYRDTHFYAVNFTDTQVGWIGGADGLLLKSTNGGLNWQQQYIPTTGNVSKIQFLDQNVGYALGAGLLFKTTDGGNSWQAVNLPESIVVNSISFVDADFGWIVLGKNIYKTENGGNSWNLQRSFSQFQYVGTIFAFDRSRVWVTYFQDQNYSSVIRSTDGGLTWAATDFPIAAYHPSLSYFAVKELLFTDTQTGYAVGRMYSRFYAFAGINSGSVFKTSDGGKTWILLYDNPFYADPTDISFSSQSQGTIVGSNGILLTITNTNTIVSPYPSRTFLPLKSIAATIEKVFAVGGVYRIYESGPHPDSKEVSLVSSDAGYWTKMEKGFGYTLNQVKFKTNLFGWKAGYHTLSTTHDGGNTWQSLLNPGPPLSFNYSVEKAYFTGDTTGFYLIKSTFSDAVAGLNGFSGTTRTFPNIPYIDPSDPTSTGMLDLQFIDDNTGFITTSNGKLIKTTDGGTSWSVLLVRANTALNRCYFVTAQIGWVVGENGLIMKTTNGGQSWTTQNSGSSVTWRGIYFLSAQEGYVVGTQGTLAKTSDGGNSWVSIVTNTRNALNDITFTTRDKGYIVGDAGTILAFNPTLLPECKTTSAAVDVSISSGTLCETAASGAWNNVATWSCGHVPLTCDQVAINPGHVVTLSQSVQVRGIEIRQNGQLAVQGGNVLIHQ